MPFLRKGIPIALIGTDCADPPMVDRPPMSVPAWKQYRGRRFHPRRGPHAPPIATVLPKSPPPSSAVSLAPGPAFWNCRVKTNLCHPWAKPLESVTPSQSAADGIVFPIDRSPTPPNSELEEQRKTLSYLGSHRKGGPLGEVSCDRSKSHGWMFVWKIKAAVAKTAKRQQQLSTASLLLHIGGRRARERGWKRISSGRRWYNLYRSVSLVRERDSQRAREPENQRAREQESQRARERSF